MGGFGPPKGQSCYSLQGRPSPLRGGMISEHFVRESVLFLMEGASVYMIFDGQFDGGGG